MDTQAANAVAESFCLWVEQEKMWWDLNPDNYPRFPGQRRFSSYGKAHREWLLRADGMELVGRDFCTAAEVMMATLVQLGCNSPSNLPLESDGRSWDHMSVIGFDQLVYRWQHKPSPEYRVVPLMASH